MHPGNARQGLELNGGRCAGPSVRFIPSTAPRVLAQLGYAFPYGPDGSDGPPLADELAWAAHASESGKVATPEPLFPRLEVESAAS